jgi:septal ring factor EnvC (AmiA/AmiB activator)
MRSMERVLGWIAPHTMLLVGLVFVVLGSAFSTIGTVRSMLSRAEENRRIQEQTRLLSVQTSKRQVLNERIDLKSDEIKEQTTRLEGLNQQISRRSEEIANQTQALQAASERLQSSSNRIQVAADETFKRFTGGLSFAILRPSTELTDEQRFNTEVDAARRICAV